MTDVDPGILNDNLMPHHPTTKNIKTGSNAAFKMCARTFLQLTIWYEWHLWRKIHEALEMKGNTSGVGACATKGNYTV